MMVNNESRNALARVLEFYGLLDYLQPSQKIVCPFHEDVNPSMYINLEDNTWFCFGCQLSGNAFKFVKLMEKKYHGLNDLQSLQKYKSILSSSTCEKIDLKVRQKRQKKSDDDLYNEAYDYYYGLSKVNWKTSEVHEVISAKEYMLQRGFTEDALNKCKAKVTYNNKYAIIFPMIDNGEFKGWVCRTTTKDVEKKRKYLYNKGFSRATTLVGTYGKKDYVIVVEGYMDRLKFLQYGIDNVVAILGWKMSNDQIKKLKGKGIKTIISALDNDDCGKRGTEFLRTKFKVVRWCYLKGCKDPGDMDEENFKKMLRRTMCKLKREVLN